MFRIEDYQPIADKYGYKLTTKDFIYESRITTELQFVKDLENVKQVYKIYVDYTSCVNKTKDKIIKALEDYEQHI